MVRALINHEHFDGFSADFVTHPALVRWMENDAYKNEEAKFLILSCRIQDYLLTKATEPLREQKLLAVEKTLMDSLKSYQFGREKGMGLLPQNSKNCRS